MSDRSPSLYLEDILESIIAVEDFTRGISFSNFSTNRLVYSATIRELQIIGEASGKIPHALKKKQPGTPWRDIKDFRNVLIHHYFGLDDETIWDVIKNELPSLKTVVINMLKECNAK